MIFVDNDEKGGWADPWQHDPSGDWTVWLHENRDNVGTAKINGADWDTWAVVENYADIGRAIVNDFGWLWNEGTVTKAIINGSGAVTNNGTIKKAIINDDAFVWNEGGTITKATVNDDAFVWNVGLWDEDLWDEYWSNEDLWDEGFWIEGGTITDVTVNSNGKLWNGGLHEEFIGDVDEYESSGGGTIARATINGGALNNFDGNQIPNATVNGGTFTNAGSVTGLTIQTGGTVANGGSMNRGMILNGEFTNDGTVQNVQMFDGEFANNGSVDAKSTVSGGVFSNNAGGYVASAEVHGSGFFNNRADGYVEEITQWGGGDLRNRGEIGKLIYLESSASSVISPASLGFSVAMPSSSGTITYNEGVIRDPVTVLNGFTFNNMQGVDEDGHYMGRVGQLSMVSGSAVNNAGLIGNLTYYSGTYNNTYNGEYFGTVDTLNLAGDASENVTDWGTVNNLAFSDDGSGVMTINGFADGTFGGISVTNTVNLANANVQMNLFGSVNDWLGLSSWDSIFFGDTKNEDWSVVGWESAHFSFIWNSGDYTDWLSYGETWTSSNGYLVAFGANGMNASAVPEPATLAVLGLGLVGLGYARRRQMMRATAA